MSINCLQFGHTMFTTDRYNVLKDKGKGYLKRVLKVYSMKQYIKLNNKTFEVKKLKGKLRPLRFRTLTDCYAKPSNTKLEIYNDWVDWLIELNNVSRDKWYNPMTVLSYNRTIFTLGCDVYNNKNQLIGRLYITKTKQEFWTV